MVGWSFNGETVEYNVETITESTKKVIRAGKTVVLSKFNYYLSVVC